MIRRLQVNKCIFVQYFLRARFSHDSIRRMHALKNITNYIKFELKMDEPCMGRFLLKCGENRNKNKDVVPSKRSCFYLCSMGLEN